MKTLLKFTVVLAVFCVLTVSAVFFATSYVVVSWVAGDSGGKPGALHDLGEALNVLKPVSVDVEDAFCQRLCTAPAGRFPGGRDVLVAIRHFGQKDGDRAWRDPDFAFAAATLGMFRGLLPEGDLLARMDVVGASLTERSVVASQLAWTVGKALMTSPPEMTVLRDHWNQLRSLREARTACVEGRFDGDLRTLENSCRSFVRAVSPR